MRVTTAVPTDPGFGARTTPRMLQMADRLLGDGSPAESRHRAGRLSLVMGVLAMFYALVVEAQSGQGVDAMTAALVAVGLISTVTIALLPWRRLPDWSTAVAPAWAIVLLSAGSWSTGDPIRYLPLYAIVFGYSGLTQRPGITGRYGTLALVGLGAVALIKGSTQSVAEISVAIVVLVCVNEMIALGLAWQRHTRRGVVLLHDALSRLVAAESESDAANVVAEVAAELLVADGAVTMLSTRRDSTLFVGKGSAGRGVDHGAVRRDITDTSFGTAMAVAQGRTIFVADAIEDPVPRKDHVDRFGVKSVVYIPVPGEGGFFGVVTVWWCSTRRSLDTYDAQVVAMLSAQAGQVIERLREVQSLDEAATTDPLTGIGNRRAFDEYVSRLPTGGSVLVFDLDRFKSANDSFGHAAGDDVLRAFSAMLTMCVRDGDQVARLGGDEFAVLLPSSDSAAAAVSVLERVTARWPEPHGVTFSWGSAQRGDAEPTAALLARADTALYELKQGRGTERRGEQDEHVGVA